MPAVVVIGAQWGDEGKGKVVDLYARYADAVVRYAGGANAGHTLVVGGDKLVLHLVPSGALHGTVRCVIGQGTVIDPEVLMGEIDHLRGRGLLDEGRLLVSDRAHVVLPHHKLVDGLREDNRRAIGTTRRGIGPTYEDKVARRGVRVGDLLSPARLAEQVARSIDGWRPTIEALGGEVPDAAEVARAYGALGEKLRPFVGDTAMALATALEDGARVLVEGAQGTMLDVDHGTYPFVTSSNAVAGGACTGAGIAPRWVRRCIGITKAYATRVGEGPFPTELEGEEGDRLREAGAEFGATTGRPRRCGWLDAVVLRYAVRLNGLDELVLTKLDVLSGLPQIKVCVAYEIDGRRVDAPPPEGLDRVRPVYEDIAGFSGDLGACRGIEDLPEGARKYIARVEELVGCRIGVVSVGPGREHTLGLKNPFV